PTSLEEVDVITGGFGAAYGSALSGVVSYSTRRGSTERWDARGSLLTDHWAPASLLRGFVGGSVSAGGPVNWLGRGTTLFADLLVHGYLDADPRASGLTCLDAEMADTELAGQIQSLRSNPNTAALLCPYTSDRFPHQQGDKYIAFMRLDRPIGRDFNLTATFLRNRFQRQLYTSEFKYNPTYQLGQRALATLGSLSGEWTRQGSGSAKSLTGRVALLRLDRYLGTIDPDWYADRTDVGGFSPGSFQFLGEDFVREPIETQLRSGSPVPGYLTPGGTNGSPFGPAAAGVFFTEGSPTLANWTRSDLVSADLAGSYFHTSGSTFRTGASAKLYRVETYERAFAHLAGSIPNYARFFPGTYSGYAEADVATRDGMHFQFGVRVEAFRSGIDFRFDRADFLSPIIETGWKVSVLPRVGAAFPIPGSEGRASVRFNFGRVAQPPDFQYFLDSTIGDSLRTDVRRQGNPDLAFEQGSSYEAGVSYMLGSSVAMSVTAFRKTLDNLVTGSMRPGDLGTAGQFSTSDFGSVKGLELSVRARWRGLTARTGWAWQKATGVTSGLDGDSAVIADPALTEYPLAFDRRHSIDLALFFGRAGGAERPWSAALTSTLQSGYPVLSTIAPPPDSLLPTPPATVRDVARYLPWTWTTDLRASYELGSFRLCGRCQWRAVADGRNLLNRKNIIALRRETLALAPAMTQVRALANSVALPTSPIPRESPNYHRLIDLNRDGLITLDEFQTARLAAAIDRYDPSLFFGESRQIRLGVEVVF
ncbi:MAG TPA: TonB-dependent receptor, partial [Longimicrobiales bacterium]|nr:TonB-dependent receptor [Longimicrobiales bacterium]